MRRNKIHSQQLRWLYDDGIWRISTLETVPSTAAAKGTSGKCISELVRCASSMQSDSAVTVVIRFKRRKLLHPKRAPIPDSDAPSQSASPPIVPSSAEEASAQILSGIRDYADAAPNLREILRARKRTQDRMRDAARKAAERKNEGRYQVVLREGSTGDTEGGGPYAREGGQEKKMAGSSFFIPA